VTKPVRPPDIVELRAFCAAVDLGSLGRAARLLRVSQPGLSKRLRVLETIADVRLLERSPRGVSPTAAGRELYIAARKLLAEVETVEALMGSLVPQELPVRLAVSPTLAEFALPAALVEFGRHHEWQVPVELTVVNSLLVRELVRDGRVELGLAAVDPDSNEPGLSETPLCDDEVVVAVPREHPWSKLDEIERDEFVRMPMIMRDPNASSRRVVVQLLEEAGLALAPPLAEFGSTSAAKAAALAECMPALLSQFALAEQEQNLVIRRVRGLRFTRTFVLVHGGDGNLRPVVKALVDELLRSPLTSQPPMSPPSPVR
jgi:DNA-binding transcriptional LysR family regulator